MDELDWIDLSEAARVAGVTRQTIYRWIEDGLELRDGLEPLYLTATSLDGIYHIDPDDLGAFLKERAGDTEDAKDKPEMLADLIEGLCENYGLNPDQRISTLMKAVEDLKLEDEDQTED